MTPATKDISQSQLQDREHPNQTWPRMERLHEHATSPNCRQYYSVSATVRRMLLIVVEVHANKSSPSMTTTRALDSNSCTHSSVWPARMALLTNSSFRHNVVVVLVSCVIFGGITTRLKDLQRSRNTARAINCWDDGCGFHIIPL